MGKVGENSKNPEGGDWLKTSFLSEKYQFSNIFPRYSQSSLTFSKGNWAKPIELESESNIFRFKISLLQLQYSALITVLTIENYNQLQLRVTILAIFWKITVLYVVSGWSINSP